MPPRVLARQLWSARLPHCSAGLLRSLEPLDRTLHAALCPHLHRDWARPCHICTGTGLTPPIYASGLGLTAASSAPGQHAWWALCCNVLYCVATLRVGACQAELAGAVAAERGAGPEAEHTNEERAEKER
jgi:hypothetical protein